MTKFVYTHFDVIKKKKRNTTENKELYFCQKCQGKEIFLWFYHFFSKYEDKCDLCMCECMRMSASIKDMVFIVKTCIRNIEISIILQQCLYFCIL